jgi:hypothetical protein
MILVCQHCRCEFNAWRARQKFCSHACHDVSRTVVDVSKLQQLAFSGQTKAEMARQLGVSYMTVRRAIAMYGFEKFWREQRYA